MKLNKHLKDNKKLNNYIQNKIRESKNAYMGKGTNIKFILNDKKRLMNHFISRNKGLQNEYNELKTENQNFSNTYKNILEYRDNQEFLFNKFKDNLTQYQKMGYRIPNLTTNSNIIKYSPLLMEGQEHINKFYLQDLYSLNKKLKKIWPYNKIQKYLILNNITFNPNSEEEDDDNEKEGINSNFFLKKTDLLAKKAFKEKKEKRVFKSLDISNWFKQDLYADPFLTQGNNDKNDPLFDNYTNEKRYKLKKQIEGLINYNNKLKTNMSKWNSISYDSIKNDVNKRHSVFDLKLNEEENKYELRLNSNYKNRNKVKKLTLTNKAPNNTQFEEFYNNINNHKNGKEENNNNKFIITESRNSMFSSKKKLLKKNKNILIKNNKSIKKIKTNLNLENINNIDKYKKIFHLYSGKEPKSLLFLINDIKGPFNKPNIFNIFSKKFKLSKINELKNKFTFLENYLCKGLLENNFSS